MNFYEAVENYLSEMAIYAKGQAPKESCGFITESGFIPIQNKAANPHLDFVMDAPDYDANRKTYQEQGILGIFHSHTNGKTEPSMADLASCEQTQVPWALYTLPNEHLELWEPSGYKAPLEKREWHYGTLDCYSIIRDAYHQLGIYLTDYVREPLFSWNTDPNWDQYRKNFAAENFYPVSKPQRYDLITMKVRSEKSNHCGIYLGEGEMLHHLIGKRSEIVKYDGYWKNCTVGFWRHAEIGEKWLTSRLTLR